MMRFKEHTKENCIECIDYNKELLKYLSFGFVAYLVSQTGKNYFRIAISKNETGESITKMYYELLGNMALAGCEVIESKNACIPALYLTISLNDAGQGGTKCDAFIHMEFCDDKKACFTFGTKKGILGSDELSKLAGFADCMEDGYSINREWKWLFPRDPMRDYKGVITSVFSDVDAFKHSRVAVDSENGVSDYFRQEIIPNLSFSEDDNCDEYTVKFSDNAMNYELYKNGSLVSSNKQKDYENAYGIPVGDVVLLSCDAMHCVLDHISKN